MAPPLRQLCALALVVLPACGGAEEPSDGPLHVVLISLDSVRHDDLTFRDPSAAPHMTRLATRGTIFTQAVSGTSWTLPSTCSCSPVSRPRATGWRPTT